MYFIYLFNISFQDLIVIWGRCTLTLSSTLKSCIHSNLATLGDLASP